MQLLTTKHNVAEESMMALNSNKVDMHVVYVCQKRPDVGPAEAEIRYIPTW